MGAQAPTAETVTDEPRKRVVVLDDLDELAVPSALAAPVAHAALLGDALGGYQMAAMMVGGPASALAAVALRAGADANLVQRVRGGAGGDDVATAALVAGEDLAGAKLEEAEAAEDVGGFGGGGVLHLGYSVRGHWGLFPLSKPFGGALVGDSVGLFACLVMGLLQDYSPCATPIPNKLRDNPIFFDVWILLSYKSDFYPVTILGREAE